jgi:ribosomal protein S18 acetylase RimI-like enzyme
MIPRIRPLAPRDKAAIINILKISPQFELYEIEVAEEVLVEYLKDPINSGYHIVVAELESTIEGYVCYGPVPLTRGTWDIYWIAVSPNSKRQGIGKQLMHHVENQIQKAQGRLIFVETSSKSSYDDTNSFYNNLGYESICRIPDFYAPKDDKIIYQKKITS